MFAAFALAVVESGLALGFEVWIRCSQSLQQRWVVGLRLIGLGREVDSELFVVTVAVITAQRHDFEDLCILASVIVGLAGSFSVSWLDRELDLGKHLTDHLFLLAACWLPLFLVVVSAAGEFGL